MTGLILKLRRFEQILYLEIFFEFTVQSCDSDIEESCGFVAFVVI